MVGTLPAATTNLYAPGDAVNPVSEQHPYGVFSRGAGTGVQAAGGLPLLGLAALIAVAWGFEHIRLRRRG